MLTSISILKIKKEAKLLNMKYKEALELKAKQYGFKNYQTLKGMADKNNGYIKYEDNKSYAEYFNKKQTLNIEDLIINIEDLDLNMQNNLINSLNENYIRLNLIIDVKSKYNGVINITNKNFNFKKFIDKFVIKENKNYILIDFGKDSNIFNIEDMRILRKNGIMISLINNFKKETVQVLNPIFEKIINDNIGLKFMLKSE